MAIELIDKIKQKNNGTFKLVDAIDVELSNGKDVDTVLLDHIRNHPTGGVATANVHVGDNPPINDDLQAWIDISDNEEITKDISDSVLDEFRNIFNVMQEQISALKVKNTELEARVYYLEMYGGGNSGITNGDILVLEDKTILTLEDGTVLTFE
jgi:DNA phosphorothioation-dependent restriction protein DptG